MTPINRQLTPAQVAEALMDRAAGMPLQDIAKKFNVSTRTIIRRKKVWDESRRLGRKKVARRGKLTGCQLQLIKNYALDNPFATYSEILSALSLSITKKTLWKFLKSFGLHKRISPKKFYIKPVDREYRMEIAIRRAGWSIEEWKKVVFTDEAGLDNSGFQRKYVMRPKNTRYSPEYVYQAPNKSLRVNYFSYVTYSGVGQIYTYDSMDSDVYCSIMEDMINDLREKFEHDDFLIVHDNAAFSQCYKTTQFMEQKGFTKYFLGIPPYSPDMNIIEQLWAELRQKVKYHCFVYGQTRNRELFIDLIKEQWSLIPLDYIKRLYGSLPVRMRSIARVEGGPTRF